MNEDESADMLMEQLAMAAAAAAAVEATTKSQLCSMRIGLVAIAMLYDE
jgi:hypothetical protein